jgi:hypothetical protein
LRFRDIFVGAVDRGEMDAAGLLAALRPRFRVVVARFESIRADMAAELTLGALCKTG